LKSEDQLARIEVRLFEPLLALGGAMTAMLRQEGFERVDRFSSFDALHSALRTQPVDLFVLEVDGYEDQVERFMRAIRACEVGSNPFVGLFVTQSNVTFENAHRMSLAGVDAILEKPYAPIDVLTHVRDVAHRPRHFVVDGPYAGPEHRRKAREGSTTFSLDAPNFLSAAMEGKPISQSTLAKAIDQWRLLLKKRKPPDEASKGAPSHGKKDDAE